MGFVAFLITWNKYDDDDDDDDECVICIVPYHISLWTG